MIAGINAVHGFNISPILSNLLFGLAQIALWGCSFFLLPVLANPILIDTGWSSHWVYGCLSLALLVSGLLSVSIGRLIHSSDGGSVLCYAGIIMGSGLLLMGLTQDFILFVLSWCIIGLAMGMGLYDALFGVLGKIQGEAASKSIVQITLISGFAPTVSWPVLSALNSMLGWRHTCIICAIGLIILIYPMHWLALKRRVAASPAQVLKTNHVQPGARSYSSAVFYWLLILFSSGSFIMTGVTLYLIDLLLESGATSASAIGIAALLGPSQVGVRLLDLVLPEKSPVITGLISSALILLGLVVLNCQPALALFGIVIFGMGNGMRSILRGTLPMAFFGQQNYPLVMGKLAGLPLYAQAITPFIGGWAIELFGTDCFFLVLTAFALINIGLMAHLYRLSKQKIHV